MEIMASESFRRQLRSVERKKVRATCMVIVLAGVPQVSPRCSRDANEVKTSVLEEALVFGGKNRVHQHYRQIFIAHRAPLLTRAVEKIGNKLRLDFRGIQFRAAAKWFDGTNTLTAELHRESIIPAKIGKLGRPDIDSVLLDRELADGILILQRAIPHACEIPGQILRSPGLTRGNMFRRGKDLCGVLQDVAGEARINHARVRDVVVGENAAGDQKEGKESAQNRQADA